MATEDLVIPHSPTESLLWAILSHSNSECSTPGAQEASVLGSAGHPNGTIAARRGDGRQGGLHTAESGVAPGIQTQWKRNRRKLRI